MARNDGGAAFPYQHTTSQTDSNGVPSSIEADYADGMSLRDYFAAHAPAAFLARASGGNESTIADHAYRYADAMLKERAK